MIIIRWMWLVCLHLVHNRQKAREHGIDRLSIQLREVLILSLVHLKESGFDLCGSLMIALKPHPDLSSSRAIGDSLKLRKRKTRKENTASLALCLVLNTLILSVVSIKQAFSPISQTFQSIPKDAPTCECSNRGSLFHRRTVVCRNHAPCCLHGSLTD